MCCMLEKMLRHSGLKTVFMVKKVLGSGKKVFVINIETTLLQNQVTIVLLLPLFKEINLKFKSQELTNE